jgi:uncharacterized SAM-binding protein YcdF (DUF218 family)
VRWFRRHPIATLALLVAVAALTLVATSGVTVWRAAHHDGASDLDHVDAIVVLGAAQYDGKPSPLFQGRLDHASLLWGQERADYIVTVGSKQEGDRHTEAEAGRNYLIEQGVPADRIIALPVGHTTYESLQVAAEELQGRGLHSVFLVSDPWHNARIESMARDLGLEGHASATWTSAAATEGSRGRGYLRETFAYLYYKLFGA